MIAEDLSRQIDKYIDEWGVDIVEILIKDIKLSEDLQESLSCSAKERRLAESKIIDARAELQAAKLMRLAAEELNSRAAMQIRYLEMLKNSTGDKIIMIPKVKDKDRIQHIITQGLIN